MMQPRPFIKLLRLQSVPVLQQLMLEERLLRASKENWCIINDGTQPPAIVMGVSGKSHALLEVRRVVDDGIPVIKRFSGGGTVIVDAGTVFVTLICSKGAIPGLQHFPRPIMQWTEKFYFPAFKEIAGFQLREHDYVFGQHKFGGNAQAIIKDRWLHHTSLLWDYQDSHMDYLKLPERAPSYRLGRSHKKFICRLMDHFPSRELFLDNIAKALEYHFSVQELAARDIDLSSSVEYLRSTKLVVGNELENLTEPSYELTAAMLVGDKHN